MNYDILQDIEKHAPHNMTEAKSKIMLRTYRLVTSVNFVLVVLSITIPIMVLLPAAFAYSQDIIDRNGIRNVTIHDLNQGTRTIMFDYCLNKYSVGSIGALVTSDLDSIPIPIDSDNIQYKQCTTYGTKILAKSDSVIVSLFQNDDIDSLVSSFNTKIQELKEELVQIQQKIIQNKTSNKQTDELIRNTDLLEKQIKSAQSSLKTLLTIKNSQ